MVSDPTRIRDDDEGLEELIIDIDREMLLNRKGRCRIRFPAGSRFTLNEDGTGGMLEDLENKTDLPPPDRTKTLRDVN